MSTYEKKTVPTTPMAISMGICTYSSSLSVYARAMAEAADCTDFRMEKAGPALSLYTWQNKLLVQLDLLCVALKSYFWEI